CRSFLLLSLDISPAANREPAAPFSVALLNGAGYRCRWTCFGSSSKAIVVVVASICVRVAPPRSCACSTHTKPSVSIGRWSDRLHLLPANIKPSPVLPCLSPPLSALFARCF
ncbi:unnamed protein product, partial [Ectocarpus sp. 13 AM-2016]